MGTMRTLLVGGGAAAPMVNDPTTDPLADLTPAAGEWGLADDGEIADVSVTLVARLEEGIDRDLGKPAELLEDGCS